MVKRYNEPFKNTSRGQSATTRGNEQFSRTLSIEGSFTPANFPDDETLRGYTYVYVAEENAPRLVTYPIRREWNRMMSSSKVPRRSKLDDS